MFWIRGLVFLKKILDLGCFTHTHAYTHTQARTHTQTRWRRLLRMREDFNQKRLSSNHRHRSAPERSAYVSWASRGGMMSADQQHGDLWWIYVLFSGLAGSEPLQEASRALHGAAERARLRERLPAAETQTADVETLRFTGWVGGSLAVVWRFCLKPMCSGEAEQRTLQRRVRTKFSLDQIRRLEKIFRKHKYLGAVERVKTAPRLKTWFQNRRMKLKREVQGCLGPQIPLVMFQPLLPVRYHTGTGPQGLCSLPVPQLLHQHYPPTLLLQHPVYTALVSLLQHS
uniref:Homeobox domain-containing protein n=1 Tax=Nothobranchius furzeri TaxID=105023 RepID=A0A8C6LCU5_NOTFU